MLDIYKKVVVVGDPTPWCVEKQRRKENENTKRKGGGGVDCRM